MINKLHEFDLIATALTPGAYFFCTDTNRLYKDTESGRYRVEVEFINTEIDRVYNVRPANGTNYYEYETNELWFYNAGWLLIDGIPRESNGYYYIENSMYNTDDITTVLDNNGLLGDGSVCVRDQNRIIKGKFYIDATNNNLIMSSFIGGGLVFLPDGTYKNPGCLEILSANTYTGELDEHGIPIKTENEGQLTFYGDMYIIKDGIKYKVLTEAVED